MKRSACLLFAALIIMMLMTACGKSAEEKQIVGTWRYEGTTYVSVFTFNEDMTCSETHITSINSTPLEITQSGTYELSKGTLMVYFDGNMEYLANIRFEDDKMIWLSILDDLVFARES